MGWGHAVFRLVARREGTPVALAHRIELARSTDFGRGAPLPAWRELHDKLRALVAGRPSPWRSRPADAVPYLDRVPHGVVELVEGFGRASVSSGTLIHALCGALVGERAGGHRRAAEAIAGIAADALRWAGSELTRGAEVRERTVQARVMDAFAVRDSSPIIRHRRLSGELRQFRITPKAAPIGRLAAGDVLLLDLWAGVALGSVFADQTWMAFAGREPGAEVRKVWESVRERAMRRSHYCGPVEQHEPVTARRSTMRPGAYPSGRIRRVLRAPYGHSIDRDLHGSGAHLDNFETADERTLIAGVGFSWSRAFTCRAVSECAGKSTFSWGKRGRS